MIMKKASKRIFRVVCVLGDGRAVSDCGHDHRTSMAAVHCPYEPRSYKRDIAAELRIVARGAQ
jgi:hypothetical protein